MRLFGVLALAATIALAACGRSQAPPGVTDISGVMPDLSFTMTRASDDKTVTAADYRGKVTLLYFGYTHCPDLCPATLANLTAVLHDLGPRAKDVRVLFVTVDPNRDSLPVLKSYVKAFAPQIDGLRGTNDEVAALARRYRVLYRVIPAAGQDYQVMHANTVYFFDPGGHARYVATSTGDASALVRDIHSLMDL